MSNVIIPAEQASLVENYQERLGPVVEALVASSVAECVDCGALLGGLLGAFTWGIAHGLGECSRCGFPYVYYHYHEVSPAIPAPMRYPRRAEELLLMAFVPNADIPLAEKS